MPRSFKFPDVVPTLSSDSLLLREMVEDDVPQWFERASDPESSALSGDPIPDSIEVCYGWLQDHRDIFRERTGIRWAIVPRRAGISVGSIGLSSIGQQDRSAEVGAVIARAYWNRGIVTSAARLVLAYAFGELELSEIRADLVRTNDASKRVLEKLGFRFARIIENHRGTEDGFLYVLRAPP